MKKFLAVIALVAILLTAFVSCKGNENNTDSTVGAKPDDVAMKTENFSINLAEATYIFNRTYIEFANENYQFMNYYGIDKEKSLKEQMYTESNGTSWFDYFLNDAKAYMHNILIYCEAANASGLSLTDEDNKEIDKIIEEYYTEAEGNGYTIEEFVSLHYGAIVKIDNIKTFMEKEKLAFKYYNGLVDGFEFTAEDEDKYFSEHPEEFYYVNYVSYTFDEDDDRDAQANAKELYATADSDAFYAYIENYEENVIKLEESKRKGATVTDFYVKEEGEFSDWAFSAKVGERYLKEDGAKGVYTVYMLTSEPAIQDYTTKDIRFLLLTKDTYETNEKTKRKAEEIIAKWEDGEKTAESFGKLASKYSEDDSSSDNDGFCPYVDMSIPVLTEESTKWLFEEANVGELKLFKGEGVYYIMYYEKESDVQWRVVANEALCQNAYNDEMTRINAEFTVTSLDDILEQIDE
ncbi:MAG: peptidylprolyl isomerase [Clostridia bacterium]|nr:peptidylprolyl isomerase [Clostridia bacterium]